MGIITAQGIRSTFEPPISEDQGVCCSADSICQCGWQWQCQKRFKHCLMAMKALTGLRCDTLVAITQAHPPNRHARHAPHHATQTPAELREHILEHVQEHGVNSNVQFNSNSGSRFNSHWRFKIHTQITSCQLSDYTKNKTKNKNKKTVDIEVKVEKENICVPNMHCQAVCLIWSTVRQVNHK